MFRVDVDSLEAYFAFDPKREGDLRRLDALISKAAPSLKRHFHKGTPAGEPGMRFKMIGYGKSFYHATTGEKVAWPVVGVALQKNYISVYFAVTKRGAAVTDPYAGRLGELRRLEAVNEGVNRPREGIGVRQIIVLCGALDSRPRLRRFQNAGSFSNSYARMGRRPP
jgi:hypothetical protein